MTFRDRISNAAAIAVAAVVIVTSFAVYLVVRGELRRQVDEALVQRSLAVTDGGEVLPPAPPLGGAGGYVRFIDAAGRVRAVTSAGVELPVTDAAREVAAGLRRPTFEDARVEGVHVRVLTRQVSRRVAVQVARPLDEVDQILARLRRILFGVGAGGLALAFALGHGVARAALAPVDRLTAAAEEVARTRDTTKRIASEGDDELGRLAASFNTMLGALDESLRAQRQLVADASHELRTPLTSMRTNIEVLARAPRLRADERARILRDVTAQLEDLTALVADLVELARGAEPDDARTPTRLDAVVARVVERARTNHPGVAFVPSLAPCTVVGNGARLERAVSNLLDNAAKWSPAAGVVDVTLNGFGELIVRDRGPGIDPADLPKVFDRFYRAAAARGRPGSGLGLAIVRHVVESHGGSVGADNAPDGGAVLRIRLPGEPAEPEERAQAENPEEPEEPEERAQAERREERREREEPL